ncbi:MAG: YciI family protein [Pseudomonadota bacterium]
MAQFLAICDDVAGSAELRKAHLHAHLEYIERIMDEVSVAGPLRENEQQPIQASCFVYHADTLDAAQTLLADDPYFRAGIYQSVRWFAFNPAAGTWVGGRNW